MTFVELLAHIGDQKEHILSDKRDEILTDKSRYTRPRGEDWRRDTVPGSPEQRFNRGGVYYIWKIDDDKVVATQSVVK